MEEMELDTIREFGWIRLAVIFAFSLEVRSTLYAVEVESKACVSVYLVEKIEGVSLERICDVDYFDSCYPRWVLLRLDVCPRYLPLDVI